MKILLSDVELIQKRKKGILNIPDFHESILMHGFLKGMLYRDPLKEEDFGFCLESKRRSQVFSTTQTHLKVA